MPPIRAGGISIHLVDRAFVRGVVWNMGAACNAIKYTFHLAGCSNGDQHCVLKISAKKFQFDERVYKCIFIRIVFF